MKHKNTLGFLLLSFSVIANAASTDSTFKAPIGSLYTLGYNSAYSGANVLKLTMTNVPDFACAKMVPQLANKYFEVLVNDKYVPLTPPASGTTWNRNYVVVDKAVALCKTGMNNTIIVNNFMYPKTFSLYNPGGDIINSTGGSAAKETLINNSYNIYKNTMQTRENHQLSAN